MIGKKALGLSGMPLLAWAMFVALPLTLAAAPLIYDRFERPARKLLSNWKRKPGAAIEQSCPTPASGAA